MDFLIERVKEILFSPVPTWRKIKEEEATRTSIIKEYLYYLVAVPVVATFIGRVFVGLPHWGLRVGFFRGLIWAVVAYVVYFVAIIISAAVINYLAPTFNAQKDSIAAFKLVTYSLTPYFVASVFNIVPAIAALWLLGLYGIYLLHLGIPILMECPEQKRLSYTVVSVIVIIVVMAVLLGLVGMILV